MNREQLEAKSKKATALMNSIQTPSGKAMTGDVQNIVNEVLNVKKIDDVLLYFGNIFSAAQDVTKLDKTNSKKSVFAKMVDYIGKGKDDNIYSVVKSVRKELSAQTNMMKGVFFEKSADSGLVKALAQAIDKQTETLKDALSNINTGKKGAKSTPAMSGNKEAAETMKAMADVSIDNAKAISMAVDSLQKLSFTNLSDFREALVIPIEGFAGLKFDEFKTSIGSFISTTEDIDQLLVQLNLIQDNNKNIDYGALDNIFSSIRDFSLTMQSLSDSSSEFNPENAKQFIDVLTKMIGDEKSGIVNVVDKLQTLKPVPDNAKESINGLAYIAGILTNLTEIADKEMTDAMHESIIALVAVIKESVSEFSKIKQKDIDKAKHTVDTYTEFSSGLVARTKEYSDNLRQSKANLDKSKEDTDAIFNRMDYTSDRSRESRLKAEEAAVTNRKEMSFEGVGRMLVVSVAVLLIGYWAIKKYPDLLKQSVKFAGTLAIFMSITVGTLVTISAIGAKLGASMSNLEKVKSIITTCTFIMLIGVLLYNYWGDRISEYSFQFAKDLAKFMFIVVGSIALVSRLAKYEKDFYKVKDVIVSLSLIMLVGALFMLIGNGKLVKAALQFAVTLSIFMAMVLLTVTVFGRNYGKEIGNVSKVINGCAVIMMVGALFVLLDNGRLIKAALTFGAVLSLFIAMVLLPFFLFGRWLVSTVGESDEKDASSIIGGKSKKGGRAKSPMEALYNIIVGSAIILMVGGIFMTIFNGRLAEGAIKFAILLGGFIILVGLALVLVTKFINSKTVGEIEFFKNSVVMFSLILMMGALLMMFPEFPIHAIGFGVLILAFTVLMGIVFALITRIVGPQMINDIAMFAVAVAIFGAMLLLGGYLMTIIEPKNIIIFGSILLGFVLAMTGVIWVMTKALKGPQVLEAVYIAGMFSAIILLLGVAFFVMGVAMKIIKLEDIGKMILLVGAFIGIFAIFLIPYVTAAVSAASAAVGLMSLALVAICGAFLIVHWMMKNPNWNPMEDIKNLEPVLWSYEWLFTKLSIMFPMVLLAGIATTAMGVGLAAMASAMWIVHTIASKDSGIDLIDEATTVSVALGFYSLIFSLLGLLSVPVILALPAATGMALTLTLLAGAFKLVDWIVSSSPDLLEHIMFMTAIIGKLTLFFSLAGLLTVPIILASVAFTTMAAALTVLSLSFLLIDAIIGDENILWTDITDLKSVAKAPLMKKVLFMEALMGAMSVLFGIVGIPPFALLIEAASIAFTMMAGAIIAMSLAVASIIGVTALAKTIDEKDITRLGDVIKGFFNSLKDSITGMSLKDMGKILAAAFMLRTVIRPVTVSLGMMARTISNIANLKYPTDWDENGKPIEYHIMDTTDFDNVKTNVKTMVETMFDALDVAVNGKFKKEIEELGKLNMFEMMFGATKNRLIAGIRVSFMLSRLIGSLGKNIASIANLMFPDEWNQQGVAIHYEKMEESDFETAGKGIVKILSVIMDGISAWMQDPVVASLIEDYQENDGNWFTGRGKSKFSTAIKMSMGIGSMIGSLATGVQQYAELKVPEYDNKGEVKRYRKLEEQDFTDASKNIGLILTNMISAVEEAYDQYSNHRDSVLEEFFTVIERTSGLLGAASQAIIDAASLRFTDLDGKVQEFDQQYFRKSYDNIVLILTTVPKAVQAAIPQIGNTDDISKVMNAIKPVGEVISNIVTAIQNYANLKIPTGYDSNGNPTGYEKINLDADLTQMGDNITKILNGMVDAISIAYTNFKNGKGDFDKSNFKLIMSKVGNIGNAFKSIIEAVQSYANLKIATGYKEDGTAIGYVSMFGKDAQGKDTNELLSGYFRQMENNLTNIITSFINVFKSARVTNAINAFNEKQARKVLEPISSCGDVIKEVIQTIKDYSELKIPMGGFDRDGKAVGGYASLDGVRITLMRDRIEYLLESIPDAINEAYDTMFNSEGGVDIAEFGQRIDSMKSVYETSSKIISETGKIVGSLANMKIATGFDKQGNATGYVAMGGKDTMDNFKNNVLTILTAIPESIWMSNMMFKMFGIDDTTYKFIKSILNEGAVTLMKEVIPNIVNSYIDVKPAIDESKNMGKDIQIVIKNIIEAYNSFKDLVMTNDVMSNPEMFEQSISDTKAATKLLESYMNTMLDCAAQMDDFTTNLTGISKSIVNLNIELGSAYALSKITTETLTSLSKLATDSILTEDKLNEIKMKLNNVGENIVLLYEGIVNPFRRRIFNRTNLIEMSMGIEQMSTSMLNTVKNFDEAAKIADTMDTISFWKIGLVISYLNSERVIPVNAERNAAIIERESESLAKFVKNVNSLDLQKTRALTSLMEQMMNMTTSVKDLNEFIKVIKNELTNAINNLAKETKNAKDILNKTDEQKEKRQKELEKTIEKIDKLMNKTLQINVSSSSVDKDTLNSAYETPAD